MRKLHYELHICCRPCKNNHKPRHALLAAHDVYFKVRQRFLQGKHIFIAQKLTVYQQNCIDVPTKHLSAGIWYVQRVRNLFTFQLHAMIITVLCSKAFICCEKIQIKLCNI